MEVCKLESCKAEASLVALTDAAFDKDEGVRQQIAQSLYELGCHNTEQVLSACFDFLLKHSQLVQGHRTAILQCMERVVRDNISQLGLPLAKKIINLASEEMIKSSETAVGWKEAASNLLVALGSRFTDEILEDILQKLQPGVVPQFIVVQTLANLAVANVHGIVPYLTTTLQTMLPMFHMVKQDNMKWAFTSAMALFSKSILEYLVTADQASRPVLSREAFAPDIYAAYRVLFGTWLRNKDVKLRSAIVVALGHMVHLLPPERMDEELPRLLVGVMGLYKKRCEPCHVTQCLRNILEAAIEVTSHVPETQMDSLLPQLHHQACLPVDGQDPLSARNQQEVLQCFTILSHVSIDAVVKFLLQKLSSNNEKVRVGTLTVLNHVVSSGYKALESKKALIVSGMKQSLQDSDNKVKKVTAQVISSMGEHGYLQLEGGAILVDFLVQQCALIPDEGLGHHHHHAPDADEVRDEDLCELCEGILSFLVSLERMEDVLWPFLLEFVTPAQYTHALAVVCRCLEQVGNRKRRQSLQYVLLNYNERLGLPKPHTLLARLLAVSALPYAGQGRGLAALSLLQVLSPNIHADVVKLWDEELPQLLQFLSEHREDTLPQKLWEDKLFFFLSRTLETITDEKWTWELSEEMTRHIHNYHSYPREKAFLYKCVGIVLGQTSNKDVINNELQEMLLSVQHNEALEREGLATGIGFCAMTHLDDTLAKLDDFVKMDIVKKTASFFNILKEKLDGDMERVKSTLILCYGYVALYAPEGLILQRVEMHILDHILSLSNTKVLGIKVETKDLMIKLTLIKAVTLIAKAVYANRGKHLFKFSRREEVLSHMQDLITSESKAHLKSRVRQAAINACTHLIRLEPRLNEMESSELIRTCLEAVFSFPPLDSDKRKDTRKVKEREVLHTETVAALHELLKEFLSQNLTSEGLEFIFKHVQEWMVSTKDHERERAVEAMLALLAFYRDRFKSVNVSTFHNLGVLVGRFVPRCADPVLSIRYMAMDALYNLLYIQVRYEGCVVNQPDNLVDHLGDIKEQLQNPDSHVLFQICHDIAKVISNKLPRDQLHPLLFSLFEGLSDYHATCSSATSVVMNTLVRRHGANLKDYIPEILGHLQSGMPTIALEQVRFSVIHFISILTSQCLPGVLSYLLFRPLPYDKYTSAIWQSLAREVQLATTTMDYLLGKINDYLSHEDRREGVAKRPPSTGTSETVAVIYAFNEMVANPESTEAVVNLYPKLFGTLLLYLSFIVNERMSELQGKGVSKKKKLSLQLQNTPNLNIWDASLEALKLMLSRGKTEEVAAIMEDEGGWELLKTPEDHQRGVALLARASGKHGATYLPDTVRFLAPILHNLHEHQRVTVATFFGELLASPGAQEPAVTELLVGSLLRSLDDVSPTVHWLSIRGLGNVAVGSPQRIPRYAERLLAAMVGGLDEKTELNDLIVLEAMAGLGKVLARLDSAQVRPILPSIIGTVQPFFENESDKLRAAAFSVFGSLARFGDGQPEPAFLEHVHASLVSLVLHLNDSSGEVVRACKAVLQMVGPHLCSEGPGALFRGELLEQANVRYWEFIAELSKVIVSEFPDKIGLYLNASMSFFKSMLPEIRGNAVVLAGFILQNLPREYVEASTDDNVCVAIIMMLHDVSPCVRVKAARVLGLHRGF
ncbi:maestro heat-like repeat-containing protein family member 1 [Chiloscyllium plagiosum]|uniref:maestro heat-like repeat-containing protein family member 1 n=1 Tax=Chiloscyllium plagiosum TaxID=36176 RepID=UPI001CB7CD8B|nr:maestro heat-like repeat-containing protein family member 1 [Chiloscyllium plagiosum]XP_043542331.1 maestro heat-like repeat-containing protein family member 1 [Chiloscyllium plagiosum]